MDILEQLGNIRSLDHAMEILKPKLDSSHLDRLLTIKNTEIIRRIAAAAAIGNPRRYVDELLAREPGLGGEGSLIVQERLDPYPGLLELNALLPRESRGGAASARNFVDGRGNRGMILSI